MHPYRKQFKETFFFLENAIEDICTALYLLYHDPQEIYFLRFQSQLDFFE